MQNDRASDRRAQNLAVVKDFMRAVGARDFAALQTLCQPDLVVELPYSDPPKRLEGFAAYRASVEPALEIFRFDLSLASVYEMADPDLLIAEYTGDGTATPTGKPYRNDYLGIFRFRGGRIASLREFYNPARATLALTPD